MTNKKAIENLKEDFYQRFPDDWGQELWVKIEKDLLVLETLKELFSNNDYLTILLKTNYLYKIKDETKLNLIKEWLEK